MCLGKGYIDVGRSRADSFANFDLHLILLSKAMIQKLFLKYNLHKFAFVQNYGKEEKCIDGKNIKLLGIRWVLENECDRIMYQRHDNQLPYNR